MCPIYIHVGHFVNILKYDLFSLLVLSFTRLKISDKIVTTWISNQFFRNMLKIFSIVPPCAINIVKLLHFSYLIVLKYFLFRYNPVKICNKWLDAICWAVAPLQALSVADESSYCFDTRLTPSQLNV